MGDYGIDLFGEGCEDEFGGVFLTVCDEARWSSAVIGCLGTVWVVEVDSTAQEGEGVRSLLFADAPLELREVGQVDRSTTVEVERTA